MRAAKAATLLRPGGRLGLFWNKAVHSADLQRRFDAVYARHAPELECSVVLGRGSTEPFSDTAASLRAGGFGDVEITSFGQDREYTTSAWLDQLSTHSDHRRLEPSRLRALLAALGEEVDRVGGRFVMHYDTVLITARKPAVPVMGDSILEGTSPSAVVIVPRCVAVPGAAGVGDDWAVWSP